MRTTEPSQDRRPGPSAIATGPVPATPTAPQVVILAAGMGTRLGRGAPQAADPAHATAAASCSSSWTASAPVFGRDVADHRGRRLPQQGGSCEAPPDLLFAYNPDFDRTNTSKSLLRALRTSRARRGAVAQRRRRLRPGGPGAVAAELIARDQSFVCVDTSTVADEEVKYTLDEEGYIAELSKTVEGGLGEAVGINYVSAADKPVLVEHLGRLRATTTTSSAAWRRRSQQAGVRFRPLDISRFSAVEVDFEEDLARANTWLGSRLGAGADGGRVRLTQPSCGATSAATRSRWSRSARSSTCR